MDQQTPHPIVLSPATRLTPNGYRSHSRSPSRSPHRRQQFRSTYADPLVSSLSPNSTLEALRAADALPPRAGCRNQILADSIADASNSERALGIRAALAAKKLREWYNEVKAWPWPQNRFELPRPQDRQIDCRRDHGGHLDQVLVEHTQTLDTQEDIGVVTYLGSLPAGTVQEYEDRIEAIRNDMEALDLEELKDHVRGAHLLPRSRSSSLSERAETSATAFGNLDDFTVVITATTMHALPWVMRLNILLDVWFVRILVLKQTPGFLQQLEDSRIAMESAQQAIKHSNSFGVPAGTDLTTSAFTTMKSILQQKVGNLGQRLDGMLDTLEGSEDTIPDHWIDDMERIQHDYEVWVVEAEQKVEQYEWRLQAEKLKQMIGSDDDLESRAKSHPYAHNSKAGGDLEKHYSSIEHSAALPFAQDGSRDIMQEIIDALDQGQSTNVGSTMALSLSGRAGETEPFIMTSSADSQIPNDIHGLSKPTLGACGPNEEKEQKWFANNRPPALDLSGDGPAAYDSLSSNTSFPGSATSECFSNMSSPEILDASRVEYFKTTLEDKTPFWFPSEEQKPRDVLSRHSSQRTETSIGTVKDKPVPSTVRPVQGTRSRASSFMPEHTIHEHPVGLSQASDGNIDVKPTIQVERTSSTSTEVLPRSVVRNITVTRSASYSSPSSGKPHGLGLSNLQEYSLPSPTAKPYQSDEKNPGELSKSRLQDSPPLSDVERDYSPSVRAQRDKIAANMRLVDADLKPSSHECPEVPNPSEAASKPSFSTPTSSKTGNRTTKTSKVTAFPARETTQSFETSKRHISPLQSTLTPSKSIDDQLAARIISLLENMPARIRLTSGPELDAPEVEIPQGLSVHDGKHASPPPPYSSKREPSTPLMTLAPAYSMTPKSNSQNDSDVKLYHLHSPGKGSPIKLHVRLVGEGGERVMVRVGGGWADLGEYLKQYALHHGRRSISDGRFEIKGLPAGHSSSPSVTTLTAFASGSSTPTSRPVSPTSRSIASRPGSAFGMRKLRRSLGSAAELQNPRTPDTSKSSYDNTPTSDESFRPTLRPISRMSFQSEDSPLGLAGPRTRRTDVSPNKQAWVDGMLDQARKTSTEKKKSSGLRDFGVIGKVGQTRRVFFKSKAEK